MVLPKPWQTISIDGEPAAHCGSPSLACSVPGGGATQPGDRQPDGESGDGVAGRSVISTVLSLAPHFCRHGPAKRTRGRAQSLSCRMNQAWLSWQAGETAPPLISWRLHPKKRTTTIFEASSGITWIDSTNRKPHFARSQPHTGRVAPGRRATGGVRPGKSQVAWVHRPTAEGQSAEFVLANQAPAK